MGIEDKIEAGCVLPEVAMSERLIIKENFIKKTLVEDQYGQLIPLEHYIFRVVQKVVESQKDYILREDIDRAIKIGGEWFTGIFWEDSVQQEIQDILDKRYKKLKGVK